MERYIYLCNDNELEKLITAFREKLQINEDVFYSDFYSTYALKEKVNLEELKSKTKITTNVNKVTKKFTWPITDIIYISIHPGGTSEKVIREKLNEINNSLQSEKGSYKILVTYHGSQNSAANKIWNKDKPEHSDINDLNTAVKSFLKPDIIGLLKKHQRKILIDMALFNEIKMDSDNKVIGEVFELPDSININDFRNLFNEYKEALHKVNDANKRFYDFFNAKKSQ